MAETTVAPANKLVAYRRRPQREKPRMSGFLGEQGAASDSQMAKGGKVTPGKHTGLHVIIAIGLPKRLAKSGSISEKAAAKRKLTPRAEGGPTTPKGRQTRDFPEMSGGRGGGGYTGGRSAEELMAEYDRPTSLPKAGDIWDPAPASTVSRMPLTPEERAGLFPSGPAGPASAAPAEPPPWQPTPRPSTGPLAEEYLPPPVRAAPPPPAGRDIDMELQGGTYVPRGMVPPEPMQRAAPRSSIKPDKPKPKPRTTILPGSYPGFRKGITGVLAKGGPVYAGRLQPFMR